LWSKAQAQRPFSRYFTLLFTAPCHLKDFLWSKLLFGVSKNMEIKERRSDQLIAILNKTSERCLTDNCYLQVAACIEGAKLNTVWSLAGAPDHC